MKFKKTVKEKEWRENNIEHGTKVCLLRFQKVAKSTWNGIEQFSYDIHNELPQNLELSSWILLQGGRLSALSSSRTTPLKWNISEFQSNFPPYYLY